jgi:ribosomal protein L32
MADPAIGPPVICPRCGSDRVEKFTGAYDEGDDTVAFVAVTACAACGTYEESDVD